MCGFNLKESLSLFNKSKEGWSFESVVFIAKGSLTLLNKSKGE